MFLDNLDDKEKEILEFMLSEKKKKPKRIFNILYPSIEILKEDYGITLKSINEMIKKELGYKFDYQYLAKLYREKRQQK